MLRGLSLCWLQADSKEDDKKGGESSSSSNTGSNAATAVEQESDTGLAKLDAGSKKDTTPVEEKIEAVAGALGKEGSEAEVRMKVSSKQITLGQANLSVLMDSLGRSDIMMYAM